MVRMDSALRGGIEDAASASKTTNSEVIRAAVRLALPLFSERPQLVWEIEAGLCKDMLEVVDFNEMEADDLRKVALEANRTVREIIRAATRDGLRSLRVTLKQDPARTGDPFRRKESPLDSTISLEDINAPGFVAVRKEVQELKKEMARLKQAVLPARPRKK